MRLREDLLRIDEAARRIGVDAKAIKRAWGISAATELAIEICDGRLSAADALARLSAGGGGALRFDGSMNGANAREVAHA
jgi:hypothetical protein